MENPGSWEELRFDTSVDGVLQRGVPGSGILCRLWQNVATFCNGVLPIGGGAPTWNTPIGCPDSGRGSQKFWLPLGLGST